MAKMTTPSRPVIAQMPLGQPTRVKDLQILSVGYLPAKRDWIDHGFDVCAVGLIVRGQGEYRVGDGPTRPVGPGSQIAVFPGPVFHYGPRDTSTWEEYFVIFQGPGVRRWIDSGWFFKDGSVHALLDIGPLVERFRELLRTIQRAAPGDADRALVMAERLLLEMYFSRASTRQARRPTASLESVLAHCHENFADEIDFVALAESHAMSYSHLRQQMRQVCGVPPHQYIIRLRCESARRLLNDTDMTIKEIAAKVGIPDPYTFSRTFRRCVGTSPAQYRRQVAPWSGNRK